MSLFYRVFDKEFEKHNINRYKIFNTHTEVVFDIIVTNNIDLVMSDYPDSSGYQLIETNNNKGEGINHDKL